MKIFVTDLDGTFLDKKSEPTQLNIDAVTKAVNKGHKFCIATGRSWIEAKSIYDCIGLDIPIACANAGHIFNPKDDSFPVVKNLLTESTVNKLLFNEEIHKDVIGYFIKGINHSILCNQKNIFVNENNYEHSHQVVNIDEEIKYEHLEMLTLSINLNKKISLDEFNSFVEGLKLGQELLVYVYPCKDGTTTIEIGPKISKEDAIKHFANYYSVSLEDFVTFGDEYNDVEMTIAAGTGVAMNNATEKLKEVANIISEHTHDQSAVAHEINKLI